MPTRAQIVRLLKPIAAGRTDVAIVGRCLVLLPVDYGVKAVHFCASSTRQYLQPRPVAAPTHGLWDLLVNWRREYLRPDGGFYKLDDRDFPRSVYFLLNERALPQLRAIKEPGDYVAFHEGGLEAVNVPFMRLANAVVQGDFATAATHCQRRLKDVRVRLAPDPNATSRRKPSATQSKRDAEAIAFWETRLKLPPLSHEVMDRYAPGLMERFSEQGDAMSDDDKRALVAALRRLEHDNIVRAGLKPYWQKAEWPVEAMLGMA